MKITLKDGITKRSATVELPDSDWHFVETLTRIIDFVGGTAPELMLEVPQPPSEELLESIRKVVDEAPQTPVQTAEARPRAVEKVNAYGEPARGMGVSMSDFLDKHGSSTRAVQTDAPRIETKDGVRVVHDKECYQTRYSCPACGHTGRRFIWGTSIYLKCHKCESKIAVVPSNPIPFTRDAKGDYFVAESPYELQADVLTQMEARGAQESETEGTAASQS